MTRFEYDLGILGGGAAGLTAAAGGAQFGAKTLLIERAEQLGGDCLHTGCVPSKTLLRTASLWSQVRRAGDFGLPSLDLPAVELGRVMDRVHSVIATIQKHDSPERFAGLGVDVRFGQARFVDAHTVELDGQRLSARSWILATGSRSMIPPVEGLASLSFWTNENVFHQQTLPQRLLILGGGPIGVEMAQAFQRLGSQVTVVELAEQILGPEDPDMAAILLERMRSEGVTLLTGIRVVKASRENGVFRLHVRSALGEDTERILEGEALLVAAGRSPNVEHLDLETAGVAYSAKGIPVDDRMRTSVPHIYAVGDVTGRYLFTHVAGYEAGIALSNSVLHLPRRADYRRVPWCTYTDPEIASVGLNEKRAKEEGLDYRIIEEAFSDNDRAQAEGETAGKIKILVDPRGRVMGCQIAGPHAGELIHEWVAVINGGVKLTTVAGAIHTYPTLAEISKKTAADYVAEKLFSDRVRKFLHVLFRLQGEVHLPKE